MTSGDVAVILGTSIPAFLGALGVFVVQVAKIIPDNKKRREAASTEHAAEMKLLGEIRAAQKNRESKEVRDLKKRVGELEKQLAKANELLAEANRSRSLNAQKEASL